MGADPREDSATRFGRYRLVEKLGAGGMAVVWRAVIEGPRGFQRSVVIKRIRQDVSSDAGFVAMLASEARLCGLLHHPGIVQVHEFGEVDGEHYLAMEWVDGLDLATVIRRCRERAITPPPEVVCFLIAEVAGALAYAHALADESGRPLEIVHRDVSPSNIVVTPLGVVKLVDFGIAKAADHARDERTRTGTLKGKLSYMSPEQAEGLPLDGRSDLFSLGIVFYEALTLARLFKGENDFETLRLIRHAQAEPPSTVVPGIDAELDAIVMKLLARDPNDRHATGDELVRALRPILRRAHADQGALAQFLETLGPIKENKEPPPARVESTIAHAATHADAETPENSAERRDEPDSSRKEDDEPHSSGRRADEYGSSSGAHGETPQTLTGSHGELRPNTLPHAQAPKRRRSGVGRAPLVLAIAGAAIAIGFGALRLWPHGAHHGSAQHTPRTVAAHQRRVVAILAPRNAGARADAAWISTALAETLAGELAAGDRLRVVPGDTSERARLELGIGDVDSLAPDALARFAAAVGADFVVLGSYTPGDAELRVELRLVDASSGQPAATFTESASERELGVLAARAGTRLREQIGVAAATPQESELARASLPSGANAARLYADGLEKLRRFDARGARDLLLQAVAAEPTHALSHSALGAAWNLLGYDGQARDEARRAFELASGLPRAERLLVEGRFREAGEEWPKAIEIYGALKTFYPDDLDYGLALAAAQTKAQQLDAAYATLSSLRQLGAPDGSDPRIDLYEAITAAAAGDSRRQLAAAGAAAKKAELRGARLLIARGRHYEGWALRNLGELARAAAAYEDGLRIYQALGHKLGQAETLNDLAILRRDQGDLDAAHRMYADALELHRELDRKKGIAQTLNNLAEVERMQGDLDGAARRYDEALGLARSLGDRFGEALVLGNLGELQTARGELGAAGRVYDDALKTVRALGQRSLEAYLLYDVGELARAQGDAAAARKAHDQALATRRALGEKGTAADSEVALARLDTDERKLDDAIARARRALEEFQRERSQAGEASARAALAIALAAAGRGNEARAAVAGADAIAPKDDNAAGRIELELAIARAKAAMPGGDAGGALRLLEAPRADAAKMSLIHQQLEVALAAAELERRSDVARAALEKVEREARKRGFLGIARRAAADRAKK